MSNNNQDNEESINENDDNDDVFEISPSKEKEIIVESIKKINKIRKRCLNKI
jgi:hypothetical protein